MKRKYEEDLEKRPVLYTYPYTPSSVVNMQGIHPVKLFPNQHNSEAVVTVQYVIKIIIMLKMFKLKIRIFKSSLTLHFAFTAQKIKIYQIGIRNI